MTRQPGTACRDHGHTDPAFQPFWPHFKLLSSDNRSADV
jgi:hypothetical protein